MKRSVHALMLLCLCGYTAAEEPRETSKRLERIDGMPSFYVAPEPVQAGHTPKLVGEVFGTQLDLFPGFAFLTDPQSVQIAKELNTIDGLNRRLTAYFPGGWDDIEGVPLAYVVDDLIDAGYSGTYTDASMGLLNLFRIELSTPEHKTDFPIDMLLHVDFTKDDRVESSIFDMVSDHRDGIYHLKSPDLTFSELGEIYEMFGPRRGFDDDPTKMILTKMTGLDPQTAIEDLPPIEGTMLVHHVYIGSFRVVSGWQWIGRPLGLHESQQPGFVQ